MQSRNQSITNKNLESKGIVMLVKDLVQLCRGNIEIYMSWFDSDKKIRFETLYRGKSENIPFELLERTVKHIASYEDHVISICVSGDLA